MIHGGFLTPEQRRDLTILARKPTVAHRVARRANALVLLDRGKSCEDVAEYLLPGDDTVRTWHSLFEQTGIKGISDFKVGGSLGLLTETQMVRLKAWVSETLPHSTRLIGAWIEKTFGVVYETRGGLIKLLNRLGLEHRKPETISRKLSPGRQATFIAACEALLNALDTAEAVLSSMPSTRPMASARLAAGHPKMPRSLSSRPAAAIASTFPKGHGGASTLRLARPA